MIAFYNNGEEVSEETIESKISSADLDRLMGLFPEIAEDFPSFIVTRHGCMYAERGVYL